MAHQRGHKDTYRVPPAASGFEWIGGLASKLAQKTLGLDASVKQSGGYVTDPQNENMRGTAKFNTAILTSTLNTRPGNNLWKIGRSEGARRTRTKSLDQQMAQLPPPQFIGTAPLQRAAYDDEDKEGNRVNKRGNIATGSGFMFNLNPTKDFRNQTKIFVNPTYKDYYDKIGNDPDSRDRVDPTAYKAIASGELQKVRDLAAGINRWAEDSSVYFGKEITVGKTPNVIPKNQRNTLNLEVSGFRDPAYGPDANRQITAGEVARFGYVRPDERNNTKNEIALNTALSDKYDYRQYDAAWTMQHEFGHVLGMAHPQDFKKGTTTQSVLAYQASRGAGSRLFPADINAYRNALGYNKQYEAAKMAADKNKAVNKKTKRR